MEINITKEIVELLQSLDEANNDIIVKFWKILTRYEKGDYIPLEDLTDKLEISKYSGILILEKLAELKIAKEYYKLYCPKCKKLIQVVEYFNDIPNTLKCSTCDEEFGGIQNAYLGYKVINDVWNKPEPGTVELGML